MGKSTQTVVEIDGVRARVAEGFFARARGLVF